MIKIPLSNGLEIPVPTQWRDVTVATYAKIQGKSGNELLASLTGIDISLIERFEKTHLYLIWECLDFIRYDLSYEPQSISHAPVIGLKTVAQLERAKHYLTNYSFWDVAPNVYAVYYCPNNEPFDEVKADDYAIEIVDNLPITSIYSEYLYLSEEINKFVTKYAWLYKEEPDENMIAAGIHRFEKYGWLNTLYQKCNGNPAEVERMKQVQADLFYMFLAIDKETNDYQKAKYELDKISK